MFPCGFGANNDLGTKIMFWPREKWTKRQKIKDVGGGGGRGSGRKETLFAGKPWDFENPACQ